jgi:hypothetical protein
MEELFQKTTEELDAANGIFNWTIRHQSETLTLRHGRFIIYFGKGGRLRKMSLSRLQLQELTKLYSNPIPKIKRRLEKEKFALWYVHVFVYV